MKNFNHSDFFNEVAQIIERARKTVVKSVNITMCVTYYEIGRMIVEQEQNGNNRAEYGSALLQELSAYLTNSFGKGFSETNLRSFRKFYLIYSPRIQQMPSAEFKLSWSHYQVLMRIEDTDIRNFYEIESTNQQWSVEQLKRQYSSSLYERLALSRNKEEVLLLANEGQIVRKPKDILKDPLVLEFLELEGKSAYTESDLETAIITRLQNFLLELGKGFLFEARQKRFSYGEQHFFVDLVFYNRLLQCYVLIDIKINELKHQDIGQMQMYVNYYDRNIKADFEKPTIGILLCKEKNDNIVQMTLPENANIYATEYNLYLPDKTLLQRKLQEWIDEFENNTEKVKEYSHD
jgi:predicted nuclease of restriction endonuclease-like (RecB) superfamily